ncbi:MAG: hypothetical protein K0S53_3075 [Bacteroidetes bacterium]|jgi:hypothetical protein|nr:hypothetical protein [Bacteroidota bacterium]MDF2453975.1 hypothetical protein [Bacteroidota bacterium]
MDSTDIWKFISAALACTISLSKIGIPTVIAIYKSNYFMALLSSCFGAILGTVVFTYVFAGLLKWWERVRAGMFTPKHPKKIFTKFNRRVIRVKNRFGLTGIALLTPILLSIPIGAFLAERFYKHKGKVILYLSVASVFWCFTLYFSFLYFYDTFKSWFN